MGFMIFVCFILFVFFSVLASADPVPHASGVRLLLSVHTVGGNGRQGEVGLVGHPRGVRA